MDYGIAGKRALVIGASRGLGAATARALALEGVEVMAASRRGTAPASGIQGLAADLSDRDAVAALCDRLAREPVDILVNNCGGPPPGVAQGQAPQAWLSAFEAMAVSTFSLTDAALPGMVARGWGRIVTIGSSGILQPIPSLALSNGVRGAVAGWSKTLAEEVAAKGITVNMVLPGRIATDRVGELDAARAQRTGQPIEEVESAARATIPAGRYGRPEEFAAACAFLCSQAASYITGSMIRVDGGMIRGLG